VLNLFSGRAPIYNMTAQAVVLFQPQFRTRVLITSISVTIISRLRSPPMKTSCVHSPDSLSSLLTLLVLLDSYVYFNISTFIVKSGCFLNSGRISVPMFLFDCLVGLSAVHFLSFFIIKETYRNQDISDAHTQEDKKKGGK
jgi:hypothetical protein